MPLAIVSDDTVVTGTGYVLGANISGVILLPDVTMTNQSGPVFFTDVPQTDISLILNGVVASGTNTAIALLGANSSVFIGQDGIVAANAGSFGNPAVGLFGANSNLVNHGQIQSLTGTAVTMDGTLSSVVNTGTISGNVAVNLRGSGSTLSNSGTIVGTEIGVAVTTTNVRITNSGRIEGGDGIESAGVTIASSGARFVNSGEITGHRGIQAITDAITLTNFGVIRGTDGIAIEAGLVTDSGDRVVNRGTIVGDVSLRDGNDTLDTRGGIITGQVRGGAGNDTYWIDSAEIDIFESGSDGGIDIIYSLVDFELRANIESLVLRGPAIVGIGDNTNNIIFGNIRNNELDGGFGDDRLVGAAGRDSLSGGLGNDTIEGGTGRDSLWGDFGDDSLFAGDGEDALFGGPGNDIVSGDLGSDSLNGGNGNDFLYGGSGGGDEGDTLYGGNGLDSLYGETGDDILFGGNDADALFGGTENDRLNGDAGNDSLTGGDGNDTLTGGSGNDRLDGDSGNDRLIGGSGRDVLAGDAGADVFDFDSLSDTTIAARDVILDLVRGADRIDLSGIDARPLVSGDQAFTFVGTAAFSEAGQVRFATSGPNLIVQINTDADAAAEARIEVRALATLTAGDFIL